MAKAPKALLTTGRLRFYILMKVAKSVGTALQAVIATTIVAYSGRASDNVA
jgi:hypothetical protein